ncbi:sensor histidine kinase [Hahella ganghwensis]|uniref:sensor histidine kinase n=1 Tax=Hahella ganghwensis TaxID=286420 RepID=UPI00037A1473|nr:ATP-binding protein [Hahella ganghwensis]
MDETLAQITSSSFAPHGYCYLWQTELVFLHTLSDALIAVSYYSIPLVLYLIWYKKRDLEFNWIFILFATFIFACGTTHLLNIWNTWHNDYYLEGGVKLLTAVVSVMTAVLIWPLLPKVLNMPSLSVLAERNKALGDEMARREDVEQELRRLYLSLEHKVAERTRELESAKQALENQIELASRAQQRFRSIFESAPNGMIVINQQGVVLQANEQALSIFRYATNELEGQNIEMLVPAELREQHVEDRTHFCDAPERRAMGERKDLYGLRQDGTRVPVEIGLNPVGSIERQEIVASVVDVSERKEYERRIENRNAALERSNRELQEFAFIASHDLREPLRKIISFSKLLLSGDYGKFTSEGEEFSGYVVSAAERMRELLDSLLSYSRVTSKGSVFQPTDLDKVIEDVQADLQLSIDETGAEINIAPLTTIECDSSQIRQLMQNVIANSLKYRASGAKPIIQVSGKQVEDNLYQVCIKDNGIGFEPRHSEQIFEVFKRLHGRETYSGTGMGLAICRKIVERHQGRIWAEGAPGKGAAFYFELPIQPAEVDIGF